MEPRVVVLGSRRIDADGDLPREGGAGSLDALLASAPASAIVADDGDAAFFRVSAAFERGVQRVVVRPGAIDRPLLEELAARGAVLGGELFLRDDDGRYARVRPGPRREVGAPPPEAFDAEGSEDQPAMALMPIVEQTRVEASLRCEEVAFALGHKPVLYLVSPRRELEAIVARHPDAEVAIEADRLATDVTAGVYTYGAGDEVLHVFLGRGGTAKAAAKLWRDGSSNHVEALGEAMGYPRCCVRAFAAMVSRRTNAAFPYVTAARTRALGATFDAALDVTLTRLVPFVPCTYGCPRAIAWAGRVAEAAGLPPREAHVVLFFDDARAITFDEAAIDDGRIVYRRPRWASPDHGEVSFRHRRRYQDVFGEGGWFVMGDGAIEVHRDGQTVAARCNRGGLGVVLPFSASAARGEV